MKVMGLSLEFCVNSISLLHGRIQRGGGHGVHPRKIASGYSFLKNYGTDTLEKQLGSSHPFAFERSVKPYVKYVDD